MDLIWEQVVVDAHDPVALGRWWAEALGWVVVGDTADEFEIRPTPDRVPGLLFVPVLEEKAGKNRLHLDFRPIDQTAEVERLLSLGARRADVGQRDASWVVLADPEGNEFCILRGRVRARFLGAGDIGPFAAPLPGSQCGVGGGRTIAWSRPRR